LLLMTIGCADPIDSVEQPNQEKIPEVSTTHEFTVRAGGATVELKLDKELQAKVLAAIDKDSKQSIRLAVRGIAPPAESDSVIGISLFLDKADATAATAADDPHFVGSAIFQAAKPRRPQNFLFDLRDTIILLRVREKLSLDKPLKITIVPYLADGVARAPKDLSIPVKELVLSLPRPKP